MSRAVVQRVDDTGGVQTLQVEVLDGEVRDDVERPQQYGLTSVPLEDSEAQLKEKTTLPRKYGAVFHV